MSASVLIANLQRRGVELAAEGDRLRYRAPRGALSPELLADLRSHKTEILAELIQDGNSASSAALESGVPAAILIDSPRYGEAWVCTDAEVAAVIRLEEQRRDQPRPVLMASDVSRLQGKSPEAITAVLNVVTTFPGARVLH